MSWDASLQSVPAFRELHQHIQSRIQQHRSSGLPTAAPMEHFYRDGSYAPLAGSGSQRLPEDDEHAVLRKPVGRFQQSSALEMVQALLQRSARRKEDILLIPVEPPLAAPSPSQGSPQPPTGRNHAVGPAQPPTTLFCHDCETLKAKVESMQAELQAMRSEMKDVFSSLLASLQTKASPSPPHLVESKSASEAVESATVAKDLAAALRESDLSLITVKKDSVGLVHALMESITQVANRVSQVETDVDLTISGIQTLEETLHKRVQAVESTAVKRGEFNTLATEWQRFSRNDIREKVDNLYDLLSLDERKVQLALTLGPADVPEYSNSEDTSIEAFRAVVKLELLQSLPMVEMLQNKLRSEVAEISRRIESSAADNRRMSSAGMLEAAAKRSDDVGPLPLYTRMLGLYLAEEPFAPGLRVVDVTPGSPAYIAGIQPYDYVTYVNKTSMKVLGDMLRVLTPLQSGVSIQVGRVGMRGRGPEETITIVTASKRF